ncbi:MAG: CPBP family intramembrane metalloprotease [Flavobacteriaceae bacterium]|jgi:membrane protease YdiL (CAAX protease family)|nr:CPBP family intramembrane metalloprotease [Flavobacteriaceae bacterium]
MNNYLKLSWIDILLTILLFFLAGNFIGYIYQVIASILNVNAFIFNPLSTITIYGIVYISYYFIALNPRKEKFRISYSLKGFHLFPVILFLFIGQSLISEYLTGLIPTEGEFFGKLYQYVTNALVGNMVKHPVTAFISVCVVTPILEEIFFRGFLLKGMLNNNVKPVKAIVISALIFGGIHLFPWQVIGGVLSGLVLGLTFYKTGSLLSCTLLHCFNNCMAFLLFVKYKNMETPELGFNKIFLLPIGIVIFLIFGCLYLKYTKNNTWKFY